MSESTNKEIQAGSLGARSDNRYCDRCGAQVEGAGAWGHDDNCPKRGGS